MWMCVWSNIFHYTAKLVKFFFVIFELQIPLFHNRTDSGDCKGVYYAIDRGLSLALKLNI